MPVTCKRCDGCGKVANSDDQEPWTYWLNLPLQSSAAVLMGLVKPIPCPVCNGSGFEDAPTPERRFGLWVNDESDRT